jgi:hypothetical protein
MNKRRRWKAKWRRKFERRCRELDAAAERAIQRLRLKREMRATYEAATSHGRPCPPENILT